MSYDRNKSFIILPFVVSRSTFWPVMAPRQTSLSEYPQVSFKYELSQDLSTSLALISPVLKPLLWHTASLFYFSAELWPMTCEPWPWYVTIRSSWPRLCAKVKVTYQWPLSSQYRLDEPKCTETNLKKSLICPILGQSDPIWMPNMTSVDDTAGER